MGQQAAHLDDAVYRRRCQVGKPYNPQRRFCSVIGLGSCRRFSLTTVGETNLQDSVWKVP